MVWPYRVDMQWIIAIGQNDIMSKSSILRITTALTADWQKPRRFAMRLSPAGYAGRSV